MTKNVETRRRVKISCCDIQIKVNIRKEETRCSDQHTHEATCLETSRLMSARAGTVQVWRGFT